MIGRSKPISKGARAVITGAASGIGRELAVLLAQRGSQVVLADIDEVGAQETLAKVQAAGGAGTVVATDVADASQVEALRAEAIRWLGQAPTLLINNAGVGAGGHSVGHADLSQWERTLGINLWGPIYGCHYFLPDMKQLPRAGIINVASAAGFAAGPRMGAYNVSKAGVMSLSETLAAELAGTSVRVTVLCPTFVKTNIFAGELIEPDAAHTAARLADSVGMSAAQVAKMTLDAHDKGRLYVVPQLDARAIWMSKRLTPGVHAKVAGLLARFGPFAEES